ncbi:MAG: hypothetical protein J1F39_00310 [Clostridiales bacterium]|nr:hypothetical protein [Clostridiales bacterium]
MSEAPISKSVLLRSTLAKYVDRSYGEYWKEDMLDAFECEAVPSLSLSPTDRVLPQKRREMLRPFIIKLLLFVGVSSEYIALVAKLIETLAIRPRDEINTVLSVAADKMCVTEKAISHKIDRCFNIYNLDMYEQIKYLTHTNPQTARDALVDLSAYVRVIFYSEAPIL